MHESSRPSRVTRSMSWTTSAWHFRQAFSVTRWFLPVIWIGSGNRPDVKAKECQKPFEAFVAYLATKPGGVWQSLHVATARWLPRDQPSSCSVITWQFAQAFGSFDR